MEEDLEAAEQASRVRSRLGAGRFLRLAGGARVRPLGPAFPLVTRERPTHDREYPGAERRFAAKSGESAHDVDERILSHILRVLARPKTSKCVGVDAGKERFVQLRESRGVAPSNGPDESELDFAGIRL